MLITSIILSCSTADSKLRYDESLNGNYDNLQNLFDLINSKKHFALIFVKIQDRSIKYLWLGRYTRHNLC